MCMNCEVHLVTILLDAYRFILTHTEVITASALHVYYSALPFVPKNSVLYEMYSHEGNSSISVLRGIESGCQSPCLSTLIGHSA